MKEKKNLKRKVVRRIKGELFSQILGVVAPEMKACWFCVLA